MSRQPAVRTLIAELTRALTSPAPSHSFAARAERIEHLDAHVLERLALEAERGRLPAELQIIESEARALRERLATRNARFARRLAARIAAGIYTSTGLRGAFARYADNRTGLPGYDALDELFAELFDAGELPEQHAQLEPDMVAYQPTPARVVLALVRRAALGREDVLCDLGSGLGHVVLASALLSGARCIGVEIEPAYCTYAERCALKLRLPRVAFHSCDARDAPLGEANIFYLYTPFRGQLLERMLERLRAEGATRPLVVCTYGPCTARIARAEWLTARNPAHIGPNELCVFDSLP